MTSYIGRLLLALGLVFLGLGLLLLFLPKVPLLGKLPGDIVIRRKNFTFYFPLTTCLLASVLLTLLLLLLHRR